MKRLFLLTLILLGSGCSWLERVEPYERDDFATDKMLYAPLTERTSEEGHVLLTREAARGGEGSFQGGCGCK